MGKEPGNEDANRPGASVITWDGEDRWPHICTHTRGTIQGEIWKSQGCISRKRSSTCEMQSGFKLGIVYIGRAGGKHKYSLLDGKDISLVKKFRFEAKVDVDRDGNGAHIYAYAFDMTKQIQKGRYFHEYIWERHCGGIAPGFEVAHKNCVSVDNRLENLHLVPHSKKVKFWHSNKEESNGSCMNNGEPRDDQSLYWMAVSRLPPFDTQEENFIDMNYNKFYNANGEPVDEEDDSLSFYECHYPPCCKMESELREFSICGRCHQVRYCGTACQQVMCRQKPFGRGQHYPASRTTSSRRGDWPNHKKFCKEKAKQRSAENPPPER